MVVAHFEQTQLARPFPRCAAGDYAISAGAMQKPQETW
jgi:hypothetical protein